MFRHLQYGGLAILLAFLFISCENDQPTSPGDFSTDQPLILHVSDFDHAIIAQEEELYPIAFEIQVTDTSGEPIEEALVDLNVVSGFGGIAPAQALTNSEGIIEALYFVNVPYGDSETVIRAYAGTDSVSETVYLHGDAVPVEISLSTLFDTLDLFYGLPYTGEVTAQVLDKRGNGVGDRNVHVSLIEGEASVAGMLNTGENGSGVSSFTLDGLWFGELKLAATLIQESPEYSESALLEAIAEDRGINSDQLQRALRYQPSPVPKSLIQRYTAGADDRLISDTLSITIQLARQIGLSFLTPDLNFKTYTGVDRSVVKVKLSDEEGRSLTNETIELSCDNEIARVQNLVRTDADGIAESEVILTGTPGNTAITACFSSLSLSDSIQLSVEERLPGSVSLVFLDHIGNIWADSSYTTKTTVLGEDGEPVVGVFVKLDSIIDSTLSDSFETDASGKAFIEYTPDQGGLEALRSKLVGFDQKSPNRHFIVHEEPVDFTGEFVSDTSSDTRHICDYFFRFVDANGVAIPGENISLNITMGWLNSKMITTDDDGKGMVSVFWDGEITPAVLSMYWKNYSKHIQLDLKKQVEINSLQADFSNLIISACNTGAIDTTSTLNIRAFDKWDNPLRNNQKVFVELINEPDTPEGASINLRGPLDSLIVSEGSGSATIYAGRQSGGKLVRVYSWRDEARQDTIDVILPALTVRPGQPFSIRVNVNNAGDERPNNSWAIEVSARVKDHNDNPIEDDIPVIFSLDPEIAHVGVGYTGNHNQYGDSIPGSAFSELIYNSLNTFDTLTIRAEVNANGGILRDERAHVLPLQEGELVLNVDPQAYFFERDDQDTCDIRAWAVLRDGHGVLINNVPIIFNATRARFYWLNHRTDEFVGFFPGASRKYTGWRGEEYNFEHNDEDGTATVHLRGTQFDFILQDWWPEELEVNVQIIAYVEGYQEVIADPKIVSFSLH